MLEMAGRMGVLGTETAFEVLARANALAAQGRSIINLGIGQPDFPTPPHIVEAGRKALADGHHGYTPANGIPSLQERVDLVHTYGVSAGRFGLQTMVDACSTQAARLFSLYPKKGTIQVGSDADLVVYDPAFRGTFSHKGSHSRVDYNAYEGWERKGRAAVVTVRGQVQARDGKFVGKIGRGQFLKREPTHF